MWIIQSLKQKSRSMLNEDHMTCVGLSCTHVADQIVQVRLLKVLQCLRN